MKYESPRIRALAEDLSAGNQGALAQFWQEIAGKAPLIEAIPDDDQCRWITFIWRSDQPSNNIVILGDIPTRDAAKKGLQRLADSDLWLKTDRIPKDARFGYGFGTNGVGFKPDPLNPRQFAGRSVAELPDAPPEPWIVKHPDTAKGSLTNITLASKILHEDRTLAVYTPSGYDPNGKPYELLIAFDGESYGSRESSAVPTPTILENLVAAKKIAPMVGIFLNSQNSRDRDLVCSAPFTDFLAQELIPWVRANFHVAHDPAQVVVAGSSYGGLCAAYTAWRYPKIFGNVLSQSGSFTYFPEARQHVIAYSEETGWLTQQFVKSPRLPVRFYLEVGKLEAKLIGENRRLRDVLEAKGYRVTYTELSGGHDYVTWRNNVGDGLIALVGTSHEIVHHRGRSR